MSEAVKRFTVSLTAFAVSSFSLFLSLVLPLYDSFCPHFIFFLFIYNSCMHG